MTRIGLFLCGIVGIVLTCCVVLPQSAERIVRSFFHDNYYTQLPVVISMLVTPIVSTAVSAYLLVNCDKTAKEIFKQDVSVGNENERAMYRVALSAVAVLVFAETLPNFLHAFGMTVVEEYEFGEILSNDHTFSMLNAPYAISFVFKLLIGFYLLFGAPHLVQWQLDRTGSKESKRERFQFGLTHLLVLMVVSAVILGLLANGINFNTLHR